MLHVTNYKMKSPDGKKEVSSNADKHDFIKNEIIKLLERSIAPFKENEKRIFGLIRLAELIETTNKGKPDSNLESADLLRAAVVFIHASLEDLLRRLAVVYLPTCSPDVLNQIPLAGSKDKLRAEKFFLGRLAVHRGKSVDNLITESVNDYVAGKSFSDTSEIAGLLELMGFDIAGIEKKFFSAMSEIILRRHQIVHRADIIMGEKKPTPINAVKVREWYHAVNAFVIHITALEITKNITHPKKA